MDGISGVDMTGIYAATESAQAASDIQIRVLGKALETAETSMTTLLAGLGETIDTRA